MLSIKLKNLKQESIDFKIIYNIKNKIKLLRVKAKSEEVNK